MTIPAVLLSIWAFSAFVFSVAAFGALGRLLARNRASAQAAHAHWPKLAILRPCEGLDYDLRQNLLSTVNAHYPGERLVYLLVPSTADPAYPILRDLVEATRQVDPRVHVELVVTAIETMANRKVAQLARAPRNDGELIVIADSDIRFDDTTLPSLVNALLADPRAAASSAAYLEVEGRTLGDRLSAALLSSTPHSFFCLAALAERSGGAHVVGGGLMAIVPRALDEVGGFAALEPYLGEDFELSKRLHARGYTIPISSAPARILDVGRSVSWVVRRFSRWATVTRQQRAHLFPTYLLLLGCTPLLLVSSLLLLALRWPLVVAARAPFVELALALVVLALVTRLALVIRLRRAFGLPADPLRSFNALVAGESLIVVAMLGALGAPIVEWRGRRYHVDRGGLLRRID